MTTVRWAPWSKIINEAFVPMTKIRDRIMIFWGSRGSSKSDYVSKQLIHNCISDKYFKCILYRKKYNTIKDSSYETIKQNIIALGLESLFEFRVSPLQIICKNGNRFLARGGDDALALKSIKDPTCVWYEEEVPNEEDFATITLTLRSMKADRLQEYFSINPQTDGNFEDNWFWKRFFKDEPNLSYRREKMIEFEGRGIPYSITVHHSTFRDNRWLTDQARAAIEDYKETDPYLYSVYGLGLWTPKRTGMNFWKKFVPGKHIGTRTYDASLPLHLSFDFNVNPYITCTIFQISNYSVYQVDEICSPNPKNTTNDLCKLIADKYRNHVSGSFVYGDPSGKHEDTRSEKGQNDYTIIFRELAFLKPHNKVQGVAPAVVMSASFSNAILGGEIKQKHGDGTESVVTFEVHKQCVHSINDFQFLKEAPDGTAFKKKVKDTETGVTYEQYGHTSDATRYFLVSAFSELYREFQNGIKKPILYSKPQMGNNSYN